MTAGIHTLQLLKANGFYTNINGITQQLAKGMLAIAQLKGVDLQVNVFGSMITPFFSKTPVKDMATAQMADTEKFTKFFWAMTDNGVFLPPSQYEAWFVSAAHTEKDIENTLEIFNQAIEAVR